MAFEPLLMFPDQSESFARGFEAGRVWATLRADDDAQDFIVHSWSAEMWLRIAEATDRTVQAKEMANEDWMLIKFSEAAT
jgi:hypothetical protein